MCGIVRASIIHTIFPLALVVRTDAIGGGALKAQRAVRSRLGMPTLRRGGGPSTVQRRPGGGPVLEGDFSAAPSGALFDCIEEAQVGSDEDEESNTSQLSTESIADANGDLGDGEAEEHLDDITPEAAAVEPPLVPTRPPAV